MSGIYTVQFTATAVTAQQDFFEITAHSTKQCVLLGFGLSQSTEIGDAMEEGLSVIVKTGSTTSGSGGSSFTPLPADFSAGAAGFVAEVNNTTKATSGTIISHYPYNWNIRVPMDIIYPEQFQLIFGAGRRLTIELATTPADSITISGYCVIQEIG